MTPRTADRPQMLAEEFEQIARTAPETVRLEFVNGKLEVKPVPDGDHGAIIMWLLKQCMRQRPELALYPEQGIKVEKYRGGRARPDGALVPEDHFAGQGEWAEPGGVLMTVGVTSYDPDTDRRDRVEKRDAYAAAGIPVHLLVDRDDHSVTVHSEPEGGTYRSRTTRPYGAVVEIPDPVGITLRTEKLKDYA
ncbi:Uma2 family endonuclease [Streptomyces radiopugnans]|uniref:Endonuclease, Uma2 family (Restriction endonuclease fold) n=1 Tax=Streptomyces radiopugnans TaxID=403935 RepID=A0A1H9CP84_9ACTN|nr:Uma2 family endonuclease [Streptomyces radiopugnans]SEQ02453.1 Endonuclease, Uma2 family (restriction endonuclease fold) [Streptomyces radiopugnans]